MKWKCVPLAAVVAAVGFAQSISGTLNGSVLDAHGLAVQYANIRVSNRTTNEELKLQTDGAGAFRASTLPSGTYRVEITAPGFGRTTYEEVKLIVGQVQTLRATLQPASTKQEVTVSAEGVTAVTYDAGGNGKNYGQTLMQEPADGDWRAGPQFSDAGLTRACPVSRFLTQRYFVETSTSQKRAVIS